MEDKYPITKESKEELEKLIRDVSKQMRKAAAELNFEAAAELRDKMIELKQKLQELDEEALLIFIQMQQFIVRAILLEEWLVFVMMELQMLILLIVGMQEQFEAHL